jgi:hypothetical protein
MTATMSSRTTTLWTPGSAFAAASSTRRTLPPRTGLAAMVANFIPGNIASIPEHRRAVDLFRRVEPLHRFADEDKARRILERRVGDRCQRRGGGDELAVADAASARGMPDLAAAVEHSDAATFQRSAAACTSIARVDAPALRRGFQNARIELELPVACTPSAGLA